MGRSRFDTSSCTANAMVDQQTGLEEIDDGLRVIHFGTVLLATFDERDYVITD